VGARVDAVVLVGSPGCQPALAAVVAASVERTAPCITALNRDLGEAAEWDGRCEVRIPESRVAARLGLAGREAPNAFGRSVGTLADRVSDAVA
jgi:hypothetical protein